MYVINLNPIYSLRYEGRGKGMMRKESKKTGERSEVRGKKLDVKGGRSADEREEREKRARIQGEEVRYEGGEGDRCEVEEG